jgi:peptidoglycan/LPS O-acetylase OafA/YrhL
MIVVLHAAHRAQDGTETLGALAHFVVAILSKLGLGVPMFFVISGCCIAATSDSSRRKPSAPLRFFLRRFRRIFPPYWALALVCVVLAVALTAFGQGDLISDEYGFIPHPAQLSISQWIGNATLSEIWRWHLFGGPELKLVGPSWTLCYEEQFYAVCGALLILTPRHFFHGIAAVTVVTIATTCLLVGHSPALQGLFLDGRWLMFAEGVALYYLLNYLRSRKFAIGSFVALVGLVWLLRRLPAVAANESLRLRGWELMGSTVFALFLVLFHPWDRRAAQSKLLRPVGLCGQMCYSLYLAHWPVAVVLTNLFHRVGVRGFWPTILLAAPLTIAACLVAGGVFHIVVERRFLNPSIIPNAPAVSPTSAFEFVGVTRQAAGRATPD